MVRYVVLEVRDEVVARQACEARKDGRVLYI